MASSNDFTGCSSLIDEQSKLRPRPRQWDLGPIVEPGSTKNDDARMVYVIRAFECLLWGKWPARGKAPRGKRRRNFTRAGRATCRTWLDG